MVISAVFAFCFFAWTIYANDYYRAEATAKKAIYGNAFVKVE